MKACEPRKLFNFRKYDNSKLSEVKKMGVRQIFGELSISQSTMSSVKVVLICLHADPASPPGIGEGGGTHSYLCELQRLYDRMGMPHLLVTRRAASGSPEYERLSSLGELARIRIGSVGPLDKHQLDSHHAETVEQIHCTISKWDVPTVLHSVYWNSGRAAAQISCDLGIPYVHTVISNGWRRKIAGFDDQSPTRFDVERAVYGNAARVFCICNQERQDLIEEYGVAPEKIETVGRPVAPPYLKPCRDGYGVPRSVNVGRR